MEIIENLNQSACNCEFTYVVIFEGNSIFGSNDRSDCEDYIARYQE